jgi:hypothetical protein
MMAKMTERENLLRVLKGETPAWVPRYGSLPNPYATYPRAMSTVRPGILGPTIVSGRQTDIFGVEYVATKETGGMSLPKPNAFILDDIRNWRDVIKAPDISGVDWEAMARQDMEAGNIDHENTVVCLGTHVGYFQQLMNFMGFTNGLVAMHEEPDEVVALFEYLSDFYVEVAKRAVRHYKPDVLALTDDTATAKAPFISPEMYRNLVKPYHARLAQVGADNGLYIDMHNCGKCEAFIDDWLDFGVGVWNPAQVMNDLAGVQEKYGNRLVLAGCWDSSGPVGWPGASEALIRQSVRDAIDAYAKNGGFLFWGTVMGEADDPEVQTRQRWVIDEYESYRETPYK